MFITSAKKQGPKSTKDKNIYVGLVGLIDFLKYLTFFLTFLTGIENISCKKCLEFGDNVCVIVVVEE